MNILTLITPKMDTVYLLDTNTVRQGIEKMKKHGYTAFPVIKENGEFAGCISEGDFLWHVLKTDAELKLQEHFLIRDILKKDRYQTVRIDATFDELLEITLNQNFAPVIDDRNCYCGIITRKSIIQYLMETPHK